MKESNISRDHIAMEAMKVLLSKVKEYELKDWKQETICEQAYEIADAMIKERNIKEE